MYLGASISMFSERLLLNVGGAILWAGVLGWTKRRIWGGSQHSWICTPDSRCQVTAASCSCYHDFLCHDGLGPPWVRKNLFLLFHFIKNLLFHCFLSGISVITRKKITNTGWLAYTIEISYVTVLEEARKAEMKMLLLKTCPWACQLPHHSLIRQGHLLCPSTSSKANLSQKPSQTHPM